MPADAATPTLEEALGNLAHQPFSMSKLIYTVLLFAVCLVVMKILMSFVNRAIERLHVERSLHTFLRSIFRILFWFLTILIVGDYIGLPVSTLLGVLGIAGLAVSLALQGTLSNLAGGIMVLVSKPFVVEDYIEAGGIGGTVEDIGLVYTKIKTPDNKIISVPNGQISGEKIINYSTQPQRRVDLSFDVSYDADPEQVKAVALEVIKAHDKVQADPEPFIRTTGLGESSVKFQVRVWCDNGDYWGVYFDLLEQIRSAFEKNGIEITYNHLNVHLIKDE